MASPSRASASTAILEARQLRSREGRGGTRNGGTRHPGPAATVPAALRSAARSGLPPPFCQAQAPPAAGRRAVVTVTAPPRACATLGASQAVICGLRRARLRCGGLGSGCGSGCCARVRCCARRAVGCARFALWRGTAGRGCSHEVPVPQFSDSLTAGCVLTSRVTEGGYQFFILLFVPEHHVYIDLRPAVGMFVSCELTLSTKFWRCHYRMMGQCGQIVRIMSRHVIKPHLIYRICLPRQKWPMQSSILH